MPTPVKSKRQKKTVQVNGAELHYVESGDGEPIVLVHGSLSDFRSWSLQMKALSKQYHVVSYSRRYHFPNALPMAGSDYSVRGHAEDLAGLIRALGIGPAHLVGSSYGAYTCLIMAARHPELIRTLIQGEPPILSLLQDDPQGRFLLCEFLKTTWQPSKRAFESDDLDLGVRVFYDGVTSPGSFQKLRASVQARLLQNAKPMKAEMISSDSFPSFHGNMTRRIKVPCLILEGQYSPALFVRNQSNSRGAVAKPSARCHSGCIA